MVKYVNCTDTVATSTYLSRSSSTAALMSTVVNLVFILLSTSTH